MIGSTESRLVPTAAKDDDKKAANRHLWHCGGFETVLEVVLALHHFGPFLQNSDNISPGIHKKRCFRVIAHYTKSLEQAD